MNLETVANPTPSPIPGVYTFKEFSAMPIERPEPIIPGFIFAGQTALLVGHFGVGKTLYSLQMAISLACGKPFLERPISRPHTVMLLDCENGPNEIHDRAEKQLQGLQLTKQECEMVGKNLIYADCQKEKGPLCRLQIDKNGKHALTEVLQAREPEIVIVDNLGRVLPGEIEDADDVKKFLADLDDIKSNCPFIKSVLLLHHFRKISGQERERYSLFSEPREHLQSARGSGRLLDFVPGRFGLGTEQFGNETYFVLNGISRSAEITPLVLERDEETLCFQLVGDQNFLAAHLFKNSDRCREVFDLIRSKLGTRFRWIDALAIRTGDGKTVNKGTLAKTLETASSNGLLKKEAGGWYVQPAK